MAKKKKKKNKQPAKKRDKGIIIEYDNINIVKEDFEEMCDEIFRENIFEGNIKEYKNKKLLVRYFENDTEKKIECKIENKILFSLKDIIFQKKFDKKKKTYKISTIYSDSSFFVPNDTKDIIKNIEIDNFNLKINKFPLCEVKDKDELKFLYKKSYCIKELSKEINLYYEKIKKLNLNFAKELILKTSYRLVIGAEQSIYETSIRLHHIYGIPYIPASAIKGVVRSYYISYYIQKKFDSSEEKALKDEKFIYYFGSQEKEGKIIFFDAFPTTKPKIEVDIMNPHYGHYYNEGKAPTDDKNPIPINFLTIENSKFKFFIASKEKIDESFITLFKEALQNHGIGGKTAVGYGYFNEI